MAQEHPLNRQVIGPTDQGDPKRRPDGKFGAGNNANPGGRPQTLAGFRAACQLKGDLLLAKLTVIALQGKGFAAVRASETILAYAYGRPNQPITGDGGKPLLDLDVQNRLEAILKAATASEGDDYRGKNEPGEPAATG